MGSRKASNKTVYHVGDVVQYVIGVFKGKRGKLVARAPNGVWAVQVEGVAGRIASLPSHFFLVMGAHLDQEAD